MSDRAANLLGAHGLLVADRMREAAGMELSSAAVLTALRTFDGASIDALRRVLGLSHSGGVRIVKRLEADGLVARQSAPGDRRTRLAAMTPEGRKAWKAGTKIQQHAERALFDGLSVAESRQLERLMGKIGTQPK